MVCIEATQLDESDEHFRGNEITQEEWNNLISGPFYHFGKERIHIGQHLKENGFSNIIRGIKSPQANLVQLTFSDCQFIDCDFEEGRFSGSTFRNVKFSNCQLQGATFFSVDADGLVFSNSRLSYTCWNQSNLNNFNINGLSDSLEKVTVYSFEENSLEGMTFQNAIISGESSIQNSSLENIIFAGNKDAFLLENCTPHAITRPVIGVGMDPLNPEFYALQEAQAIRRFDGIPVFYMNYPTEIDWGDLGKAVSKTLAFYESSNAAMEKTSRARFVLDNPCNEHIIERVKSYAKEFFSVVDSLIIPGGDDVPEILYKKFNIYQAHNTDMPELARSLMEFALLDLCEKNHKPAMGICRGSQIMNVFLNGTLTDVPHETGPLKPDPFLSEKVRDYQGCDPCSNFIEIITEEEYYALSLHHQAAEQLGETVVPLLRCEDVLKFALAKEGLFIMSQVHPEVLVYDDLAEIISDQKALALELKILVETLKESYDPTDKTITETIAKFLKYIKHFNFIDYLLDSFDLIDEDDMYVRDLYRDGLPYYRSFSDKESTYEYISSNKVSISEHLDKHAEKYVVGEKKFAQMMKFAHHVFNLFFDLICLFSFQKEERVTDSVGYC